MALHQMERYSPELQHAVMHFQHADYYFQDNAIRPDDIFLASYPRSGNHYVRFIIWSAVHHLRFGSFPKDFSGMRAIPDIHKRHLEFAITTPRIIKTHYPFDPRYRNILHLIRDPRDVIVSYYHYAQKALHNISNKIEQALTISEFVELFLSGKVWPGDLRQHSDSYLSRSRDAKYILIKYEQLLANPQEQVSDFLSFLEINLSADVISRLIEHTSFENMSRLHDPASALRGGVPPLQRMLRKGTIGDYKNHLPHDALHKIEQVFQDYLGRYGYA